MVLLFDCLLHLLPDNTFQTSLNLASTELSQASIGSRDVAQKKADIHQCSDDETQSSNDPDDQREQHGEVNDCFSLVALLDHDLDVDEELLEA